MLCFSRIVKVTRCWTFIEICSLFTKFCSCKHDICLTLPHSKWSPYKICPHRKPCYHRGRDCTMHSVSWHLLHSCAKSAFQRLAIDASSKSFKIVRNGRCNRPCRPLPLHGLQYQHRCLAPFLELTTSTVYMAACKLNKSFSFDKTLKITGHVCFLIHM